MKAAIISLESKSSLVTIEAMKHHFTIVDSINLKDVEVSLGTHEQPVVMYNGKPLKEYDCIYAKGSFRYAPILRSVTATLQEQTFTPINPESFIIGHDKILTHLTLQQNNIPMPITYLASSATAAKKILNEVNYPIVLKFPHGTQGIGVMVADSYGSASSMLDALIALKQPFLIQEYIDTDGEDVRAFVIGNKVIAGVKRKASKGEVRANIHQGATGEPYLLSSHAKRVAIDTAKAMGAEICAVDMLEGSKGPLVIEVNMSPGIQGISSIANIDIGSKISEYLYQRTKQFKESQKNTSTDKIMEDLGIVEKSLSQQIITHLQFRGDHILLPKVVTDLTGFTEADEFVVKVEKGKVIVERS